MPNLPMRLIAFLLFPVFVQAETLDEIVVTAGLREKPLNEVAMSVSVFDQSMIKALADQHFEELIRAVPNLNWSGDGNRARYFQIRGVGELEQYEGAPNPSVGFLIDDIDFSGIGSAATLFDIDRVEVLRGPQGSRYGANALGGLIYLQSTRPTESADGFVSVGVADDDTRSVGAAFGGPLTESLSVRLGAQKYETDGFRTNTALMRDDTNARNETTVRARVAYSSDDRWELDATVLHVDADNGYDAFSLDNSLTTLSDEPGRDAQQTTGASIKLRYNSDLELTAISSIADSDIVYSFDADWGNENSWDPFTYDYTSSFARDRQTLSQEFRLASTDATQLLDGRLSWLIGFYGLRLEEDLLSQNEGEYFDPFFDFADSLSDSFTSRYTANSIAIFSELEMSLGDDTVLNFGLRAERRTTDYSDENGLTAEPTDSMLGGELSLRHALNSQTSLYATLSAGFKAGGFNLGILPADRREFGEERLWSLELGAKAAFGNIAINAAAFYNERHDQQVRTSFQLVPGDPASFVFLTDNAATGETLGAEVEFDWSIDDAWSAWFSLGLLDASFRSFANDSLNLQGRDQAHAPGYTAAAGTRFTLPSGFFMQVDASAVDRFYFDVSHDQQSEAYALAGIKLGIDTERWSASLWARNLFDRRYAVRGFFFGNEPPNFPPELYVRLGDPRLIGMNFEWRF